MNIKSLVCAAALFAFASVAHAGPVSPCYWSGAFVRCLPTSGIEVQDARAIRWYEGTGGGTNYAAIKAPATLAGDYTLTLPPDDGNSGEVLKTDGSGVLSWIAVLTDPMTTRGDIIVRNAANATARLAVGAANRVLRSDGTDPSWSQVAAATDISGTLPVANGGLNQSSAFTAGGIIYAASTTAGASTGAGTTSQWTLSGGTGIPTFSDTTTRGKTVQQDVASGAVDDLTLTANASGGTPDLRVNLISGGGTAASPAALATDKLLGSILFKGNYSTTANQTAVGASIVGKVTSTWSSTTDHAGRLEFYTAKATDANETLRVTITSLGGVNVTETGGNGGNVPHICVRRTSSSAASATCSVTCSAGEGLTGGGCVNNTAAQNLQDSYPSDGGTSTIPTTWSCTYSASVGTCTARAICCAY